LGDDKFNLSLLGPNFHFPKGIRIGCDEKTKRPVFHFISEEVQAGFLEHLTAKLNRQKLEGRTVLPSEGSAEIVGGEAATTVNQVDGEVALTPSNSLVKADFAFADLVGSGYGKWSSIELKDISIRFAV